ncbi:MAG: hypothetical protein K6B28_00600 [Lachnospiraceae bacterium]|nr:hypothetical protein [Lachnospiraceae bacterium]
MIITFINWIYIFLTCLGLGFGIRRILNRFLGQIIKSIYGIIITGLVCASVYAEFFSIFNKVSLGANIILILICLISFIACRKDISEYIRVSKDNSGHILMILITAIVLAAIASDEPSDYDTYLYHAQSVQWIEKFGVVKGLANLHNRFGYNSAFMCLQALYSFSFLGRSLHELNGFICLFMASFSMMDNNKFRHYEKKSIKATDLLKLSALFYIVYAVNSISSTGSDIMPMLLLIYLFIKWCGLCDNKETEPFFFALLSMLAIFLCTVKLSVLPAVLILLYPVYLYIRQKKFSRIFLFSMIAVLILAPFVIRNVLITGYLLYPMESIDIFSFDWEIPAEIANLDRKEILSFARGLGDNLNDLSFSGWLQIWFKQLKTVERLQICVTLLCVLIFIFFALKTLIKKETEKYLTLFTTAVTFICFLYWLFSAPSFRFGIIILMLFDSLVFGYLCLNNSRRIYSVFLILSMGFVFCFHVQELYGKEINLVYPSDYKAFECEEISINGITFYRPLEGDEAGYDAFPESPHFDPAYIELRGDDLKDGFRMKQGNTE